MMFDSETSMSERCFGKFIEQAPSHVSLEKVTPDYLYDHSSSDKEIAGRGLEREKKVNEESFEDDGSMACPQLLRLPVEISC